MSTTGLESHLNWFLNHSLQAGMLVLLVLLIQWIFRRHLTSRWRFALWWLVILRLLLPFGPASALSLYNIYRPNVVVQGPQVSAPSEISTLDLNNRARAEFIPPALPATLPGESSLAAADPVAATPTTLPLHKPIHSRSLRFGDLLIPGLILLWLTGVLALSGCVAIQLIRFLRQLARSKKHPNPVAYEILVDCQRRFGIARKIDLLETDAVKSPALFGLFRLRLLLPEGLTARFTPEELRYIFMHELAHLRRGDLWVNWVVTILQIIHWFNPLVWLGFARLRADRELACDEFVLQHAEDTVETAYGHTIIKLLEGLNRHPAIPGLVGILEDKQQMKRRIAMIAKFKKSSRFSFWAAVLLAALMLVTLTDAQIERTATTPNSTDTNATVTPVPMTQTNVGFRSHGLNGTVLLPTGKPAAGVKVGLQLSNDFIRLNNGSLRVITQKEYGFISARRGFFHHCGPIGQFSFPSHENAQAIIAVNDEGFAIVPMEQFKTNSNIVLQLWGHIEGTLHNGRRLEGGETVSLGSPVGQFSFINYSVQIDDQGRFVMTNVPPGKCELFRNVRISYTQSQDQPLASVLVQPGLVTQVVAGTYGKNIAGQARCNAFKGDWKEAYSSYLDHVRKIASKIHDENYLYKIVLTRPGIKSLTNPKATYTAVFLPDGSFRAYDVPPGEYELLVSMTTLEDAEANRIVSLRGKFVIPAGTDTNNPAPINVGTIDLTQHVQSITNSTDNNQAQEKQAQPLPLSALDIKTNKPGVRLDTNPQPGRVQNTEASGLSGVVVEAGGTPANGVTVILTCGSATNRAILSAEGKRDPHEKMLVRLTGPDGRFAFPPLPEMLVVTAMGPSGCKMARASRLATNATLRLAPWTGTEQELETKSSQELVSFLSSSTEVNEWLHEFLHFNPDDPLIPEQYRNRTFSMIGDPWVKVGYVLYKRGTNAWPAIPLLLDKMFDTKEDYFTPYKTVWVLASIRADESPYSATIKQRLANRNELVEPILTIFSSPSWRGAPNPEQERFALFALEAIGSAAPALPELLSRARSAQEMPVKSRSRALSTVLTVMGSLDSQDASALPILERLLQDSQEIPQVRVAAGCAIVAIQPTNTTVLPLFRKGLADEKGIMRVQSADGLRRLGVDSREYLPVLTNALAHKLASVRCAALGVLSQLGEKARSAQPAVQSMTNDKDEKVRQAAADAFKKINGSQL